MKRTIVVLLLSFVMLFAAIVPVSAQTGQPPVGSCPAGYVLHPVGEHEGDATHQHHVGLTVNLNGNTTICVKHLESGLHVHVDDVLR